MMRCLANAARGTELLGRSFGLASAYRQLAVSQDSEKHSFLSVYSHISKRAGLFRQIGLPLGSRTTVNAFIRCACFLQWVAGKYLMLPASCYFEDFVSFTPPVLASYSNLADFPSRLTPYPLVRKEFKTPEGEVWDAFKGSISFIEKAKTPHSAWVGAVAKAGGVTSPIAKK